eukprot:TRINITY_DN8145_c0_g2_i1.p5 TRINITY_DN8145_c0_g2~~TRINITY_DN8145_c0_g2_i1.p5  ORF type:complete len:112 (-),score=5.62 TRINITY_DN8145_c0_g2_i1:398-733(-)
MFMYPELVLLSLISLELLFTGKFLLGMLISAVLAYQLRSLWRRELFLDQTEVFKQLITEKRKRFVMMGVHFFMFIIILYRLVTSALGMMSPSGREMVRKLFEEAAATLHHY